MYCALTVTALRATFVPSSNGNELGSTIIEAAHWGDPQEIHDPHKRASKRQSPTK